MYGQRNDPAATIKATVAPAQVERSHDGMSVEESRLPATAAQRQSQIMRLVRELVVLLLGTAFLALLAPSIHSAASVLAGTDYRADARRTAHRRLVWPLARRALLACLSG